MKTKQTVKRLLDLAMVILLPLLMAEILTGQEVHEWLGVAMVGCLLIHHILNFSWLKSLFRGKYSPVRFFMMLLDILLLADILTLAASGVMMSSFVFSWLPVRGGLLTARRLHLFASYWGLILMSAHLGLHIEAMLTGCRKLLRIEKDSAARVWILRLFASIASFLGVYAFASQKISDYLFLQTHFVIFDETKPASMFFLETIAIIVLFSSISYYLQKLLLKLKCSYLF